MYKTPNFLSYELFNLFQGTDTGTDQKSISEINIQTIKCKIKIKFYTLFTFYTHGVLDILEKDVSHAFKCGQNSIYLKTQITEKTLRRFILLIIVIYLRYPL